MTKEKLPQDDQTTPAEAAGADSRDELAESLGEGEAAAEQSHLLEELREDLEAAKDRVLRSQAELENYRKRAAREIEDHRRYANLPLLRDLLPVLDNIERAIGAADKSPDAASLLEGVKMVQQQFDAALKNHHCTRIAALDQPFDPHMHEAISQQPNDDLPSNTVVFVARPGFQLYDRVVRPSQVIVSTRTDGA